LIATIEYISLSFPGGLRPCTGEDIVACVIGAVIVPADDVVVVEVAAFEEVVTMFRMKVYHLLHNVLF